MKSGDFGYIVFDGTAQRVIEVQDNLIDAVAAAKSQADGELIIMDPTVEADASARDNPAPMQIGHRSYDDAPATAMRAAQLTPVSREEVMSMGLEEAYRAVRPYMPRRQIVTRPIIVETGAQYRAKIAPRDASPAEKQQWKIQQSNERAEREARGEIEQRMSTTSLKAYAEPKTFADTLIGGNLKMDKPVQGMTIVSNGHSLAPYWSAFTRSTKPHLERPKGVPTLCYGATPECRASCLVGTGQNVSRDYKGQKVSRAHIYKVKGLRTKAFVSEPVAYSRLLFDAVSRFAKGVQHKGGTPSFRLNVYSDVPWELFFKDQWFFRDLPYVRFYDYTKVPNRDTIVDNYDLTFSYAGTKTSIMSTETEMRRGLRAAVVFATNKDEYPGEFLGMPVISGDDYDARWIDPTNCVVGLFYKTPTSRMGERVGAPSAGLFVVPVLQVEPGVFAVAHTPKQSDGDLFEEAGLAANDVNAYELEAEE